MASEGSVSTSAALLLLSSKEVLFMENVIVQVGTSQTLKVIKYFHFYFLSTMSYFISLIITDDMEFYIRLLKSFKYLLPWLG